MKRHTGDLRSHYRFIVSDERGRVTSRTRWKLCRSYVQQWVQGHSMWFNNATEASVRDTTNVLRTLQDPSVAAQTFGDLTQSVGPPDDAGLLIGTDGTAVAIGDFFLVAPIAEGVGAGQMKHQLITVGSITVVAGVATFLVSRAFVNASGGAITVREFAAVCHGLEIGPGNDRYQLAREIASPAAVVNNLSTLTLQATVRISV